MPRTSRVGALVVGVLLVGSTAAPAHAGWSAGVALPIVRASIDTAGGSATGGPSGGGSLSGDGRYVAFSSQAFDLVANDGNGKSDAFVHDLTSRTTVRASVDTTGGDANGESYDAQVSDDGRYVAFQSEASDLVPEDGNAGSDVFVRDVAAGTTTRVSVDVDGGDSGSSTSFAGSFDPSISADGRYVTFRSYANDLVADDANGLDDVFVRDLLAGTTTRVSIDDTGGGANGKSFAPSISANGRYVSFHSLASDLVPGDGNGAADVFVRDLLTATTTRASVDTTGGNANGLSSWSAMSADGRHVSFESLASDLVPSDGNAARDVFVRDLVAGITTRVSLDEGGGNTDGPSRSSAISGDGRYVTFLSAGSDLVPGDTNDTEDVFVRDRAAGTTTRASVDTSGGDANRESNEPSISRSGGYVAFASPASDLVPGDGHNADVFVAAAAAAPVVSVGDVTLAEGKAVARQATFTVTLSRPVLHDSRVDYVVTAGDAAAGLDFEVTAGTVFIAAGLVSAKVKVLVNGDTATEGDETFAVTLSDPLGATLGRSVGTGTIRDDDPAPPGQLVTISDARVVEGNGGTPKAQFTISLSKPAVRPVTVSYATLASPAGGAAVPGVDFIAVPAGTITIPAGSTFALVAVKIVGDEVVEADEAFTVRMTAVAGGASIGDPDGLGTSLDDD